MIALVLSGGGNRGALEAGALLALFERGVRPDMLLGASVGALNAAFIAADPTLNGARRLVDVWSEVRKEQIYPGNYLTMAWRFLRGEDGLLSNRSLKAFIEAHMPPAVRTFGGVSGAQLYIAATNLNTGRLHVFGDDPSDTIVDALMASTALPPYFPPWHYRGWQYVDEGTTCNVPICLALKRGARVVYAIVDLVPVYWCVVKVSIPILRRCNMMMKFFAILRKYLPIFVLIDIGLALVVGSAFPTALKGLKPWVPVPLFFMLYPMMINFRIENAAKALRNPKVVLAAQVINFVISPPLAALFARLFFHGSDPYLIAGFILKVTVAGSGMVAAWTGFAKGRVETALSIVATGLILIIFVVPLWMVVLVGSYVPVHPWLLVEKLGLEVILPLVAGVLTRYFVLRRYGLDTYERILPVLPAVSSLGMYAIVFIAVGMQAHNILNNPGIILLLIPAIVVLYSLLFVIAMVYAKVVGLDYQDAIAIGYSTTAKNHSITLALAITAFGGMATLPPAFAPIVQIPLMIIILRLSPWLHRRVFPPRPVEAPDVGGGV